MKAIVIAYIAFGIVTHIILGFFIIVYIQIGREVEENYKANEEKYKTDTKKLK